MAKRVSIRAKAPSGRTQNIILVQVVDTLGLIGAEQLVDDSAITVGISKGLQLLFPDGRDAVVEVQVGLQQGNVLRCDLGPAQEHPLHGGRVLHAGGIEERAGDAAIQRIGAQAVIAEIQNGKFALLPVSQQDEDRAHGGGDDAAAMVDLDIGLSVREIARTLELTQSNVQKLIWRAKQLLRKELEKEDITL